MQTLDITANLSDKAHPQNKTAQQVVMKANWVN